MVYGETTFNMMVFVVIIAVSIFLIWFFRYSRQDPEHALKLTTRKMSLFTWTWEKRERKWAVLNSLLIFALCWSWILSFIVPFASHLMSADLWDYEQYSHWNLWTIRKPLSATGALYGVYLATCIYIPSAVILITLVLWFVPLAPVHHSKLRVLFSWMQMFSCIDVYLVSLWATLKADNGLFWELIRSVPDGPVLTDVVHFQLHGYMLPTVAWPGTAAILMLWFRHYIGKQLRRRLESRREYVNEPWHMHEAGGPLALSPNETEPSYTENEAGGGYYHSDIRVAAD